MKRRLITGLFLACAAILPVSAQDSVKVQLREREAPPAMPQMIEGKTVETQPTEKPDNKPAFPEQTRAPYHRSVPFTVTTVTDKLNAPWSLAFLPDGKFLVSERLPGGLRIIDPKGNISAPLTGLEGMAGTPVIEILDVVLDPHFASNHRIFFCFFEYGVHEAGQQPTNSNTYVARATLNEAAGKLSDAKVIFRSIPAWPSKRLGAKTGGRIAFAKDGTLFVTVGDRDNSPRQVGLDWMSAQKLDQHLGKVLHLTVDGAPAAGNPFIGKAGAMPEIWSYGSRSPEGLAFDPATGALWETELGPRGGDEINIIKKGANYGWPVIVHGIDYPGSDIADGSTAKAGMEQPVYYWDPSRDPSGMAFYNGRLFPQWRGSLFVALLNGMFLDHLTLANGKIVAEEPMLADMHSRIRDVRVGPDGAVYVLTDSSGATMIANAPPTAKLLKLTPK